MSVLPLIRNALHINWEKLMRWKRILDAFLHPKYLGYILSKEYIKWYEGFSYNFTSNGEKHLIGVLAKEPMEVIFDVGANIGEWTQMAIQSFQGATIHSFELSDLTFPVLTHNLRNEDRVQLNNCGLSNETKEIVYKDYGENSGVNTIIPNAEFHDRDIVPTMRKAKVVAGDQYCLEHKIHTIDFLKIDVEGAEHLVLEGFSQMLRANAIKVIQFEYGYTHADAKFLIKDFYDLFEKYGYVVGPLKPTGVLFRDFVYALNDFNSGPNYVAVPKKDEALIRKICGTPIKGFLD